MVRVLGFGPRWYDVVRLSVCGPHFRPWLGFRVLVSGFRLWSSQVLRVVPQLVLVALLHGATAAEERAELAWCSGDCGPVWLL